MDHFYSQISRIQAAPQPPPRATARRLPDSLDARRRRRRPSRQAEFRAIELVFGYLMANGATANLARQFAVVSAHFRTLTAAFPRDTPIISCFPYVGLSAVAAGFTCGPRPPASRRAVGCSRLLTASPPRAGASSTSCLTTTRRQPTVPSHCHSSLVLANHAQALHSADVADPSRRLTPRGRHPTQAFHIVPGAINLIQGPTMYHEFLQMGVDPKDLKIVGHRPHPRGGRLPASSCPLFHDGE